MDHQIDYELLLDPEGAFKQETLAVGRLRLRKLLSLKTGWRYVKWVAKARPGRPTAGLSEPSAVVIIDGDRVIRYVHRGETVGDYPPIDDVLGALATLNGQSFSS